MQGKQKVFQFYLDPYTDSWILAAASCITEENRVMGPLLWLLVLRRRTAWWGPCGGFLYYGGEPRDGENRLYSGKYHSLTGSFFILFLKNNVKIPDFIVIGKWVGYWFIGDNTHPVNSFTSLCICWESTSHNGSASRIGFIESVFERNSWMDTLEWICVRYAKRMLPLVASAAAIYTQFYCM